MTKYLSKKINIISFLLILMVVLLHGYNLDNYNTGISLSVESYMYPGVVSFAGCIEYFLSYGICIVAVPIFFLISGYLFFLTFKATVSDYFYKLKSRFFSLMIPYAIWVTLAFLAVVLLFTIHPEFNGMGFIFQDSSILDPVTKPIESIQFQFWFLRDLIALVIISPIIYLLVRYTKLFWIFIMFAIWFSKIPIILPFDGAYDALLFFSLGAYLSINKKQSIVTFRLSKNETLYAIAGWIAILLLKTWLSVFGISIFDEELLIKLMFVLHKLVIVLGVVTCWFAYDLVGKKLNESKVLNKLSATTFFVYALHVPALEIIKLYLLEVIPEEDSLIHLAAYFGNYIVICSAAIALALLMNKYLPRVYGVLTGNRSNRGAKVTFK